MSRTRVAVERSHDPTRDPSAVEISGLRPDCLSVDLAVDPPGIEGDVVVYGCEGLRWVGIEPAYSGAFGVIGEGGLAAVYEAGADWVVLGNTVWGAGIDIETRRPLLTGGVGGYSGRPIKPIALRCMLEVNRARPDIPILGTGGVATGADVVEFLLAGASAVGIGTAHFASPRIGGRIMGQLERYLDRHNIGEVRDLVGAVEEW